MKLENFINDFEIYMSQKNLSKNTISNYICDLNKFNKWYSKQQKSIDVMKAKDLRKYVETLSGLSATTINRNISSLKTFYKFLMIDEIVTSNQADLLEAPKTPYKQPDIMSKNEIELLKENSIKKVGKKSQNFFRNFTILHLFLNTGIRREELTNIRLCDLDLDQNRILIHGKGNKERFVYLSNDLAGIISEYIHHRTIYNHCYSSDYLFISSQSKHLSLATVNNIIDEVLVETGLKKEGRSVHSLRKAFAKIGYEKTGDIYTVANALGHSNLATVKRYVGVDEEKIKKIFF